ncbi:glycosyltransferase family 34 protein, partial [Myriangium duriaei CBS 260.36]
MEEVISPGRDLLGARTRVGKVTIIFGGAPTYERAVRTHELHDRIHGYPLHVLRHGILDDVWSKPAYILSLLLKELSRPETERLQWLLWVDADTILLNPHVPIETFLPPEPEFDDVHLLITNDWNGLNNGVFPIRVNQWAVDLFAAIVSFRHYKPDANLVFRDQSAMDMLLKDPKFAKHTMQAPQRWFNAYQGEHNETLAPFQVRRGDFLVHFAGVGDRDRRMAYWLDRVDQHLPDWEIEVHHTSYPSEAREFW